MQQAKIVELIGAAQRLAEDGRIGCALSLYEDWAGHHPTDPLLHVVHYNRGVLLMQGNALSAAADAFSEAIRINTDFLPPRINLGTIHEHLGAADAAFREWRHVVDHLAAVNGDALSYKTTALKQLARMLEARRLHAPAEDALRQVIEMGSPPRDVVQHWLSLRQRQCIWPLTTTNGGLARAAQVAMMAPLTLANHADDPLLQLAGAASYAKHEIGRPAEFRTTASFVPRRPGRLRIGYLSSDLRDHAIGYLTADLFRLHDRDAFEVFIYYCGIPQEDATKRRIRESAEHWISIAGLDDDAALRRMLDDGIDILVDLNGHTNGARSHLLARRPAPALVNWLGYPGTMGTPYHQYIIADATIIPPDHDLYYSERVLRLPCYQPNDRHRAMPERLPTRVELGLPEDGTIFCCFNGAQKITPFTFDRWLEILRRVEGSILWLLQTGEAIDIGLRQRAAAAGIAPERLIFAPFAPTVEHLARYAVADLFLDTMPYSAHTTASDALWMGVPVLALPGRSFASRVSASLVSAAGMPELVCDSPADYVERAVALGQDRDRLRACRTRLLEHRDTSVLFDTPGLVYRLEELFRNIAADVAAGRLPQPDLTNLDTYLEIGVGFDHDAEELAWMPDYAARYRQALAYRHAFSPLPPDGRLWGQS
ncbi:O-linked N-acetylglucosamine transferase, SPINDLY family protein [Roseicella aquatilis]|uniref:O-GlcNAc transferase C-terminal domain-containing protein n=1 Tax=Roseicella aquatilis TaxID=2527868 RepID=A0A4R4D280_9PROT|nr:hypothetical protein [Roseicella aquatilis]TCZ52278.1 hypothetical protein EXY23_26250 [Roseicella aquatilis]